MLLRSVLLHSHGGLILKLSDPSAWVSYRSSKILKIFLRYLGEGTMQALRNVIAGAPIGTDTMLGDFAAWQSAWKQSTSADPDLHAAWLADVLKRAAQLGPSLLVQENPRVRGLPV